MPRSWPNTEPDRGVEFVDPPRGPGSRPASQIEIEVLDLGPVVPVPIRRKESTGTGHKWAVWAVVAAVIATGLALIPENATETTTTEGARPLPEPEMATTSTTLGETSVGLMSDATFSLSPTSGLDGFARVAGPVEFEGKYWMAGNPSSGGSEVAILASTDGAVWETQAVISEDPGRRMRIEDLDTFGGILIAVGTNSSAGGPGYAPPAAESLVLWKSTNGREWSSVPISEDETLSPDGAQLTTGPEEVLITGYRGDAFDPSVFDQIPPELIPGLERGDFGWWHDSSSIRVVAPPGIELFRMPFRQPGNPGSSEFLFRSENLIIWENLPAELSSDNLTATFDGGFLSYEAGMMYSSDGRSWDRTDRFPTLFYQNWEDRLLGLDYSRSPTRLVVFDQEGSAVIELPAEVTIGQYGISITPGPAGLAAIQGIYDETSARPITRFDGYTLIADDGVLRIEEPGGEQGQVPFVNGWIKGTYLPDTDSIRIETRRPDSKPYEFPVSVFLDLRGVPQRARFDVFLSQDGFTWSRPQTGLRAGYVDVLGSTDQSFLIGLHNFRRDYSELPIAVYRTGPIG
jgi:hypothetical protein